MYIIPPMGLINANRVNGVPDFADMWILFLFRFCTVGRFCDLRKRWLP